MILDLKTEEWMKRASCARAIKSGYSNIIDFSTDIDELDEDDYATAKSVCSHCPVRSICLSRAVEDPDAFGLRGGYFFDMGHVSESDSKEIFEATGVEVPVIEDDNGVYASDSAL